MAIENDLYSRLTGFVGLSELVGTRVHQLLLPQGQNTYPAITYQRISTIRHPVMGTTVANVQARFQINIWAETPASMQAVGAQVQDALMDYGGTASVEIERIFFENELQPEYEEPARLFRLIHDYIVCYRE